MASVVDDPSKKSGSKRAGTVISEPVSARLGDHNDSRSHIPSPPRGVGLTQSPFTKLRAPALPSVVVGSSPVPRREFDFEQKTPPAMDPNTYHALQTLRGEVLSPVEAILKLVEMERAEREAREKAAAEERERRRKWIIGVITALGVAIAGIVAAAVHGCAS